MPTNFLDCPEPRKISETRPIFSTTLPNLHVHERGRCYSARNSCIDLLSDRDANVGEATWRILCKHFGLSGLRRDEDAREFVESCFGSRSLFFMLRRISRSTRALCQPIGLIFLFQKCRAVRKTRRARRTGYASPRCKSRRWRRS